MQYDDNQMFERVAAYCKAREKRVHRQDSLGHGSDGAVWKTNEPSAVKAIYKRPTFATELECYRRLQAKNVRKIAIFNIPYLEGFDEDLMVIEISFVRPPFFLDFGKASLDDRRPEYRDRQFLANARHVWREDFKERWAEVESVISHLRANYGILYLDPRHGNVNFGDDEDDDDDWETEPELDYSSYE